MYDGRPGQAPNYRSPSPVSIPANSMYRRMSGSGGAGTPPMQPYSTQQQQSAINPSNVSLVYF